MASPEFPFFLGTTKPRVHALDPLVAERIAAGEVIERPASVVKELVENAIDAGALSIEIHLSNGGLESIEVIDNGWGMSPDDLRLSVCRHATSKLSRIEDLDQLHTLGFRGEALPSIASVAELIVTSQEIAENQGSPASAFEIRVAHRAPGEAIPERVGNRLFNGSTHGTRVQVLDLFSQIPARLKFMKSAGTEANACREIVERLSLAHPEISFLCTHQGRELFRVAQGTFQDRIAHVLANDDPYELLEAKIDGDYSVHVIWIKGQSRAHTRDLIQVINGRPVRDRTLQSAILSPLKQSFLPGNFPVAWVSLRVPSDRIDMNVHPTKSEVRFLEPGKIFAVVHAAFQRLLDQDRHGNAQSTPDANRNTDAFFRESFYPNASPPLAVAPSPQILDNEFSSRSFDHSYLSPSFGLFKGIWFNTYLLFEKNNEIWVIDQHAAHERIRYETLKKRLLSGQSTREVQHLLQPEAVAWRNPLDDHETTVLSILNSLGFDAERFGEAKLLIRSVPALWDNHDIKNRVTNLMSRIESALQDPGFASRLTPQAQGGEFSDSDPKSFLWDERLFEKIAMEACRSSLKANDRIDETWAHSLAHQLFLCDHPHNCPHGRPTTTKLSEAKVETWFQRRV